MALNLKMAAQEDLKPKLTVFGVGGAGGNAVNNMIAKNLEGVEFVVANTDAQALGQSDAESKIQLGATVTEGLGAGARPEVGARAAEEAIDQIVDHLAGSHMCFIAAGMGGGTGTGAAPIIAQSARELGILTVGVVTKPFQFEGAKRMRQAESGVEELQKVVDTLIIIPNQNLFRLANEKTTFADAFSMADEVLHQGVKGVTDLMVRPGLINLDFADVRAVMDEMGKAMMGTGEESGDDRAVKAAEKAIANPLLDEISLKGARGVLISITGSHDLTLFEVDEAANRIRDEVDADANIIVGSTLDTSMEGVIRVSVVATGIDCAAAEQSEHVPRRTLAEPLSPAAPEPELAEPAPAESEFEPEPVAAEMHDPEPAPPPEAAVAAAPEPEPELIVDDALAEQDWSAPDSAAAQAPEQGWHGESAEVHDFGSAQPGGFEEREEVVPSPEVMARLERAVMNDPSASGQPAERSAAAPAERPAERPGGFNGLIQRMIGAGDEPARPAAAEEPRLSAGAQAPQGAESEEDSVEIPAFLRRQAN